jgi:uncharacterized protein YbaR (Trm112 family)
MKHSKLLRSPCCKAQLSTAETALVCSNCQRHYPIREGIPVLLAVDAYHPKEQV